MDFLSGFAGGLTGIVSGIAQTANQVSNAVQGVQNAFNPPAPAQPASNFGITYGPYVGTGASISTGTLVVLGLAAWFLLRRR